MVENSKSVERSTKSRFYTGKRRLGKSRDRKLEEIEMLKGMLRIFYVI